jgi:hypothetical protein
MTLRFIINVLLGFLVLGGGGYAGYTYLTKPKPQTYIICPADVKSCKDGIGVGRISPSCEFALCPEERPEGNGGIRVLTGTSIAGSYTGTLESVRENGGDYECISTSTEGITGTVYASQGELRADFDAVKKPNVRAVPTHLILAKSATYAWTDITGSGITFVRGSLLGDEKIKNVLPLDSTLPQVFNCTSWTRDVSMFSPSPDLKFKDVTPLAPKEALPE